MVGRTHELGQIRAALTGVKASARGMLVAVSGEAGVGKTRLCDQVSSDAHDAGLRVVMMRCWTDGGAPALWPWQPILAELAGLDGNDPASLLASDSPEAAGEQDRFKLFTAVVDRLADVCASAPACVIIDDIHAADAGTLLLTRFVARSLQRLGLALVVTRRSGQPGDGTTEAGLLDELEREALPVVLRCFDLHDTGAFLTAHGLSDPDPGVVQALFHVTKGSPLFLRRIVALGPPDAASAFPAGLEGAITAALDRTSPAARQILRTAAVLGPGPKMGEVTAVADAAPAAVLAAAAEARAAGLVSTDSHDSFTFTHELVRTSLEADLEPMERLDVHARAADVLGAGSPTAPEVLARRAQHALGAAPRSAGDARAAVTACQVAARAMIETFAYEQADALLSAAVRLHDHAGVGDPSGELIVAWAEAAYVCGRLGEARHRFDRAARVADHEGDPVLLARAAIGLGGHWVNEHRERVERLRVLGLQRTARQRLEQHSGGQSPLAVRLDARLAAEAVYDGGPVGPVYEALEAARALGDRVALAEVLSLTHHALLSPEHNHFRLDLADELLQVAVDAGEGVLALMGLCWRAVDLFHLGDQRAGQALENLRLRADTLNCQHITYIVDVLDVMLLVRAGRLDEAEAKAVSCHERGEQLGEADATSYLAAHLLAIRWIQGRDAELLDAALDMAVSPQLVVAEFAFRAASGTVAARAGERDRARATLDELAARGLETLPGSSTWLTGMAQIAELASMLDDEEVAREAYDLLLPYANLPVMPSLGVVCLGSAERALGLAAATFGDHERAARHLERAVTANRRLANRPLVAITKAELAGILSDSGRADAHQQAVELLEAAIREARAMGLEQRAEAWGSQLAALKAAAPDGRASSEPDASPGAGASHGVIRREGKGWLVQIGDRRAYVSDRVGLAYLHELLTHPGRHIPALTLAGSGRNTGEYAPYELLDRQARQAYADRASELTEELAEAEANADIGRAEQLRAEMDALVDQLEQATGLGGQPRLFADQGERARTAVRKAITRALDEIEASDAGIAEALRSSITTGSYCSYTPDQRHAIVWSSGPV